MIFGLQCLVLGVVAHLTKGKVDSKPYASHGSCKDTTTEYLVDKRCCNRCMPGQRAAAVCTEVNNTICETCQDGTYSENYNYYRNCFKCSKCQDSKGLMYANQCTTVSDAVCKCKPGMTCQRLERGTQCAQCHKSKICPPGQGMSRNKCSVCPDGTFSGENSTQPCRAHTRCDLQGRRVLAPGSSLTDVVCDMDSILTTTRTATRRPSSSEPSNTFSLPAHNFTADIPTISLSISKFLPNDSPGNWAAYCIGLGAAAAVVLLVLLTLAFIIRHRKGLTKPPVEEAPQVSDVGIHNSHADCQHLLGDNKTETSTLSSDSHSQVEHCHGRSAGGAPDSVQSELPSPCVNLSITATFSCQLNPSAGSCSVPHWSSCTSVPPSRLSRANPRSSSLSGGGALQCLPTRREQSVFGTRERENHVLNTRGGVSHQFFMVDA